MEKGRKHNVPLRYITFLASKGINLTALFDDNITPDEFARVATQRSGTIIRHGECHDCAAKDRIIERQDQTIRTMEKMIGMMEGKAVADDRVPDRRTG